MHYLELMETKTLNDLRAPLATLGVTYVEPWGGQFRDPDNLPETLPTLPAVWVWGESLDTFFNNTTTRVDLNLNIMVAAVAAQNQGQKPGCYAIMDAVHTTLRQNPVTPESGPMQLIQTKCHLLNSIRGMAAYLITYNLKLITKDF